MSVQFDLFVPVLEGYYNTIPLKDKDLLEHKFRTGSQNFIILELLKINPDKSFTPWDVVRALGWPERMKVSAGRSLTDLTNLGYLMMTGEKRMETCGEWNNCWQIK